LRKDLITVIVDRAHNSKVAEARAAIEKVLEALKPIKGLRVRVTRQAGDSLRRDKAWQPKPSAKKS
jgi:hypothetical protein